MKVRCINKCPNLCVYFETAMIRISRFRIQGRNSIIQVADRLQVNNKIEGNE